jgi:hypothetical protein
MPAKGEKYTLKISEPAGLKTTYPLPAVKENGATLSAAGNFVGREEAVKLTVANTSSATVRVTLCKRDVSVILKVD